MNRHHLAKKMILRKLSLRHQNLIRIVRKNFFPKKSSFEPNTGFYFLPFGGLAMVDDFDLGVNTSIESKKGYSLGASFGYRWKYFYLEERISYAQAQLERFHNAGTSTSVSGEISNLSFQQAIGLNFNFNEWFGVQIGLESWHHKK